MDHGDYPLVRAGRSGKQHTVSQSVWSAGWWWGGAVARKAGNSEGCCQVPPLRSTWGRTTWSEGPHLPQGSGCLHSLSPPCRLKGCPGSGDALSGGSGTEWQGALGISFCVGQVHAHSAPAPLRSQGTEVGISSVTQHFRTSETTWCSPAPVWW